MELNLRREGFDATRLPNSTISCARFALFARESTSSRLARRITSLSVAPSKFRCRLNPAIATTNALESSPYVIPRGGCYTASRVRLITGYAAEKGNMAHTSYLCSVESLEQRLALAAG